ncbi:MAG: hypothetical protein RIS34_1002 [Pseudomonadota bacterium]
MKLGVAYRIAIKRIAEYARLTGAVVGLVLLSGCAAVPSPNPKDPWEAYNRDMTRFNEAVDSAVLKPAATAYQAATPALVRTSVSNFFGNLGELWTAMNGVLQLKGQVAVDSFMRFNINTFFGLGGIVDLASEMRLERHHEDFGQTLGRWGVPPGPYLVLPLLGPSTLRDTAAFGTQSRADLVSRLDSAPLRNSLHVLRALELRANLLRAGNVLDEAALDKYSFTRDVFLQRRESLVFDGREPDAPDVPDESVEK